MLWRARQTAPWKGLGRARRTWGWKTTGSCEASATQVLSYGSALIQPPSPMAVAHLAGDAAERMGWRQHAAGSRNDRLKVGGNPAGTSRVPL